MPASGSLTQLIGVSWTHAALTKGYESFEAQLHNGVACMRDSVRPQDRKRRRWSGWALLKFGTTSANSLVERMS